MCVRLFVILLHPCSYWCSLYYYYHLSPHKLSFCFVLYVPVPVFCFMGWVFICSRTFFNFCIFNFNFIVLLPYHCFTPVVSQLQSFSPLWTADVFSCASTLPYCCNVCICSASRFPTLLYLGALPALATCASVCRSRVGLLCSRDPFNAVKCLPCGCG